MFLDRPNRPEGEPLRCRGCERPILGRAVDGYHETCAPVFKSLLRAMDMLSRGFGGL
jgi:hypothetical protein